MKKYIKRQPGSLVEKIESIKFGSTNLARDILSPIDNLNRALKNLQEDNKLAETIKNLVDGLKMVQKEFINILERHGIKKIEAINKNLTIIFTKLCLK